MLWKTIAVAASLVGVLASAPAASAATTQAQGGPWAPGNCPQGMLCIWPNWNHPAGGPVETPSVLTNTDWSGYAPAFNFYNYTSRNAEITWTYTYLGTPLTGTVCAPANWSGDLYVPMHVTKVSWQPRSC